MFVTERAGVKYTFADTSIPRQTEWLEQNFSIWEPFTFEVFKKAADKEKICLDIGAWIGLTAIWLCNNFKEVICIEGDKDSVESLRKNLEASSCTNARILSQPVSNIKKKVIFGPNAFLSDTSLNESTSQIKTQKTKEDDYEIETITFEEIIKNIDIHQLGFIKCDIEGGEEDILEDILNCARLHSIKAYISFHISWWKDKNIRRFHTLFKKSRIYDEKFQIVSDPIDYLEKNPMGSLYFTWIDETPPIRVLVPLYNGVEFLEECLKSIKDQIYTNWTCLIGVNGHSEDGGDVFIKASSIVKSLSDTRFSITNIPHVRGAPQAINWMVEQADTEWVAHLDADDRWHPMKLQCQVKTLEMHGDVIDIMGTWCEYFGDWTGGPNNPGTFVHPTVFERVNPMIHSSILIRKSLAVYTDEFFGIYDYDCWCKNLLNGARFYNVPLALTYHRVYDASAYNASGRQKPEEVRLKYFRHT